ncbi:deoxyxylulose-5-phosphate synthase [Streptomyces sp. SCA3-4]|uniref:deoxyxylulose-5-phosphate synthase n=1 Tax=Streptomyces sichuanensis TaxID=2871810 RepID=UPI001CE23DCD|nr:deoxyxylulose-5-phosphate synthase [Streptomyces sichuanensis]MCA6091503.1 deoxyxylulose-5-phosphate synthase [Streptomyces sichuanensis]
MPHGKTSYVCLPCRASYKQPHPGRYDHDHERICPRCTAPLIHVGSAFAPPRRRDVAAWRALSVLLHAGVRFHKSCCGGPGWRPRTWAEVRRRMAYARATGEPADRALLRSEL